MEALLNPTRQLKKTTRVLKNRVFVKGETCSRLFLILAMKRSGHHAFLNWLASGLGSAKHINNAVDGREERKWLCPRHSGGEVNYFGDFDEDHYDLIVSLEDFDIDDWSRFRFEKFSTYRGAKSITVIVLVRDFRNWLASCLQRRESPDGRDVYDGLTSPYLNDRKVWKPPRIDLWLKQARELTEEKMIPSSKVVSFDRWFQPEDYRETLCRELNVFPVDSSRHSVSHFGGGSSFDKKNMDGFATQMAVLSRYKDFQDDAEYREIINHCPDQMRLSERFLRASLFE